MSVPLTDGWRQTLDRVGAAEASQSEYDAGFWTPADLEAITDDQPRLLRRAFDDGRAEGGRLWLCIDGLVERAAVWVDGRYLGDVSGGFVPQTFALEPTDGRHAVVLENAVMADAARRRSTSVRLFNTGPMRIARLKVLASEASAERAVLTVRAEVDAIHSATASIRTTVRLRDASDAVVTTFEQTHSLSAGPNRLRWTVLIEEPRLWWPASMGEQPLYDVTVTVSNDAHATPSDTASLVTGLRQVTFASGRLVVNGERLFVKGVALPLGAPTDEAALAALVHAGVNVIHQRNDVALPGFYDLADRLGLLVFHDLPAAPRAIRQITEVLGHRPSIAVWAREEGKRALRRQRDTPKRLIERADSSRPSIVVPDAWEFGAGQDAQAAAFIARLSRRSRFITFRAGAGHHASCVDALRSVKYEPIGGFIALDTTAADLAGACQPVRLWAEVMDSDVRVGDDLDVRVHLSNDAPQAIEGVAKAEVVLPHGTLAWTWAGSVDADAHMVIGVASFTVPSDVEQVVIKVSLADGDLTLHQQAEVNVRL